MSWVYVAIFMVFAPEILSIVSLGGVVGSLLGKGVHSSTAGIVSFILYALIFAYGITGTILFWTSGGFALVLWWPLIFPFAGLIWVLVKFFGWIGVLNEKEMKDILFLLLMSN